MVCFQKAGTIPAGEGVVLNKFYTGSRSSSNPLPFNKPFFTEKVPFSFTLYWQMVSLYFIKFPRNFFPFNCCKCNVF